MTSSPSSPRSGRMLYLAALKPTLEASLCLQDFHSQNIERHNKPEIEVQSSSELLLNPVTVCRSPDEKVTVEASINSTRINLFYLHSDPLKRILRKKFLKFMTRRAEQFIIVRRKPVAGFDVSFLITNFHLDHLHKHKIVDFILYFIEDLDKEAEGCRDYRELYAMGGRFHDLTVICFQPNYLVKRKNSPSIDKCLINPLQVSSESEVSSFSFKTEQKH